MGKNQANSEESSQDEQQPIFKTKKEDLLKEKKLKRRDSSTLAKEKIFNCPECVEMNKLNSSHKINSYASIPSLYTHMYQKHNITKVPEWVKPSSNKNSKVKKGRPGNSIQIIADNELVQMDDIEDKLRVLKFFENQWFIQILQSLMFTDGFLSKNESLIYEKGLSVNQIISIFQEISNKFGYQNEFWFNKLNKILDYLQYLSELVVEESFIFIFFAIMSDSYTQLYNYSNQNRNEKRFDIVCSIIEKETLSIELKMEFIQYFKDLHYSLNGLIESTY